MSESGSTPYVGPSPFSEKEAEFFFGRKVESRELLLLVMAYQAVLFY